MGGGRCIGRSTDTTGTGSFSYVCGGNLFTAANAVDNLWFQSSGRIGDTVFDLHLPSTKAAVFNTIDHGPLPGEAIESTAYLSNDRQNWTQAVVQRVWLEGWQPNLGIKWDGFAYAVGTATGEPFRYVSIIHGGPGALLRDGDNEINGIVGLDNDFNAVRPAPPTISVGTPADVFPADSTVVLSGRAMADQPRFGSGQLVANSIVSVTVNGKPVDLLDGSGSFFTQVAIPPGQSTFTFTATDAFDQSISTTLTLTGVQSAGPQIDFSQFSDITGSFTADYARTSFSERPRTLYADVAIQNKGQYPADVPLLVGVTNVSDPSVRVLDAAGVTPQGIPYYDFTGLVSGGSRLQPNASTGTLSLTFHDPNRVPFTYDLVFFGLLNRPPAFTTVPAVEANPGRAYRYDADAADPDGDPLRFTLRDGPRGLTVNAETGLLTWTPAAGDLGTHPVTLREEDGRGGSAEQRFTISVVTAPPNRPPYFTSVPVVEAAIGVAYRYPTAAIDPDGDTLIFALTTNPAGMTIDATTGAITWTPTAAQLGDRPVTVAVSDGRGGTAEQRFTVCVKPSPGNHPPVIVSQAIVSALTGNTYTYDVEAVDSDSDALTYSLARKPQGMQIDHATGRIIWNVASQNIGTHNVTVRVEDGRGGFDAQSFTVDVSSGGTGVIRGCVFRDVNGDGQWTILADSVCEFSGIQGKDNWYYGYYDGPGMVGVDVTNFHLMSQFVPNGHPAVGDIWWVREGTYWTSLWAVGGHGNGALVGSVPPRIRDEHWAVRGWISEVTGEIVVRGHLAKLDHPEALGFNGVTARIFVNNTERWSQFIGPFDSTGRDYELSLAVQVGDRVDFVLDPTDSNDARDASVFTATIFLPGHVESKLPSWTVYLDDNRNGRRDPGERFAVTDSFGKYVIRGVPAGQHVVAEEGIPGWVRTAPANYPYEITVRPGETVSGIDFGNQVDTPRSGNSAPTFRTTAPRFAQVGELLQYNATAFDIDTDALTFDLPARPVGMTVHRTLGVVVWTPTFDQLGIHDVVLRVRDDKGGVALQSFQVTVTSPNTLPVVTSAPPAGPTVAGLPLLYQVRAQDADGDPLRFRIEMPLAGMAINETSGRFMWTPIAAQVGRRPVVVLVEDGKGGQARQTFELQVAASATNDPPRITSRPRDTAWTGVDYAYLIEAVDPNGDPLTFRLTTAPTGMAVNADGLVTWKPAAGALARHSAVLQVADGRGGAAEQSFTVEVVSYDRNQRPRITSNPHARATAGRAYELNLSANDPDGDPLRWQLDKGPRGMSLDPFRGTLRWTPAADQLGNHEVVVRVEDALQASDSQRFTITVSCFNLPPAITSRPPTTAAEGTLYVYAVRADDPENDPLTFSLLGTPPTGMTIGRETGLIRWTPPAGLAGTRAVAVRVEDGQGNVATQNFNVLVTVATPNRPPVITSTPRFAATVDRLYEYAATASDPDGDALTFALAAPVQGMTIDPATGRLRWTPAAAQLGSHIVTLTASDPGGARATQSFAIEVKVNEPPRITSTAVTTVAAGAKYRYDVRAADPNGDPLTYAVTGTATGMTIDAFGRIEWLTSATDTGSRRVQVSVTDPYGAAATQSFDLALVPDTEKPRVEVVLSDTLVNVRTIVLAKVTATDNVGVRSIRLTMNGNPVALDQNGEARLTMSTPGLFTFEATAADAAGNAGTSPAQQLRVLDPSDSRLPIVRITSPANEATITYLTPIRGTVDVPAGQTLEYYAVDYARLDAINPNNVAADDPDWVRIVRVNGPTPVRDGVLATFDPTMLANDGYVIRVIAFNTNGLGWAEPVVVSVAGNAKLGEFRLEFTDLEVPLAGIPIRVTRVYDTRHASQEGDFGFGWKLGVRDADIRETVPPGPGRGLFSTAHPFIPGKTRVYLTSPAGERIGFTYEEQLVTGGFIGALYKPVFKADPGVYDRLETDGTITRGAFGFFDFNPDRYRLTTKDGLTYHYHQQTGLEKITDKSGNVVTFTRDGIQHSSGTSIRFERDPQGRIRRIIDPAGKPITYAIDAQGDLRSVTDQENLTTRFTYRTDRRHYLDEVFDPLGRRAVKTEYDDRGRIKSTTDALGNKVEQNFDPSQFTGTIRDANGNLTLLVYNDRGNVLRETDPLGKVKLYEYSDPNNPDLETKITDKNGNVIERQYDRNGNVLKILERGSTAQPINPPHETVFTYDAGNRVKSARNPRGHLTLFDYDAAGGLIKVTNAAGDSSTFTNDSRGRPRAFADFKGNATTFEYVTSDQPTKVTFADGTYQTIAYNGFGQVTVQSSFEVDGTLVEKKQTEYDNLGRVTAEIDGTGNVVRRFYKGQQLDYEIIVNPASPNETPVTPIAQRRSRITDYEYDDGGRLLKQIDANGGVVEYRYDRNGNRVFLKDPVGTVTTWIYDGLNRIVEEQDPFYRNPDGSDRGIPKPSGASCSTNTPAAHVTLSCYDSEGNRTKIIDRNARRREFSYDHAGRLLTETWHTGATVVYTATFTYDAAGNTLTARDPFSSYTHTYDILNRLTSVDNAGTPNMPRVVLTYAYNKQGNVTSATDNFGVKVESEYNARNLLGIRKWHGGGVDPARVDFRYNAAGRMKRLDRFADLTGSARVGKTDYTHDLAGGVDTLMHRNAVDAVLAGYDYDYDFAGLVVRERRTHQNPTFGDEIEYRYDRTGQLVDAFFQNQQDEQYEYDANGNRRRSHLHGDAYRTGTASQLQTDGQFTYEYDGQGNLIGQREIVTGNVTQYAFDHRNRLVHATTRSPGGVILSDVRFVYDVLNRRVGRLDTQHVLRTVYSGANAWADYDTTGMVSARYLFGVTIDGVIARYVIGRGLGHYLTDRLGTVRDGADAGVPSNHFRYDSFGTPLDQSIPNGRNRFLYSGREFDSQTGLYYYRARYYSPLLGRFLGRDPLGVGPKQSNLYVYADNDPVNKLDPTGGFAIPATAILVGALAGVFALLTIHSIKGAQDAETQQACLKLLEPGGLELTAVSAAAGAAGVPTAATQTSLLIVPLCQSSVALKTAGRALK